VPRRSVGQTADKLAELRVADVDAFLAFHRYGSVASAARARRVTPSQVSKAIARLESQLGVDLLVRGAGAVMPSEAAQRLTPKLQAWLEQLYAMRRPETPVSPTLTLAAQSFLNALIAPAIAKADPALHLTTLEVPQAMMRVYLPQNIFDVAVMVGGDERLPSPWAQDPVGELRSAAYGRPSLAQRLGPSPSLDAVRAVPFITPVHLFNGEFVPSDDDCPLSPAERIAGHKCQTILLGLELAAGSDQLVFGPEPAARAHLSAGRLVQVPVQGWNVRRPMTLVYNAERLSKSSHQTVLRAIRAALAE
jgi:DNA-binding transcriptional LysR family regulator